MAFSLQACGQNTTPPAATTNSRIITDQAPISMLNGSNGGSPSTTFSAQSMPTESVPLPDSNSAREVTSMWWFLGSIGAIAAIIGIAYLITGGEGMFGNPVKKENETPKNPTPAPTPAAVKSLSPKSNPVTVESSPRNPATKAQQNPDHVSCVQKNGLHNQTEQILSNVQ